ncbi:MAG: class I SAM-dependent methyltransferase [Candidatus Omnitrophica bacterium]|nr:class I SAM-dependent methyltransferase [Candidatus Omnitrophota bacterium]
MSRQNRDKALFDDIAVNYGRKDSVLSSSIARRAQLDHAIAPVMNATGPLDTIVDIGCGIGAQAVYLKGRYRRYIGIDHSGKMIEAARLFNRDIPNAEFIAREAEDPGLQPDTADLILAIGALHHMTDLDKTLDALRRIAKPGAFFVAVEPHNANPFIQCFRKARQLIDKGYSREQIFFRDKTLIDLLIRHRLDDLTVEYYGFLSPPFAQVIVNPQTIFAPLSRIAARADAWCAGHLPLFINRYTFNMIVRGRFNK